MLLFKKIIALNDAEIIQNQIKTKLLISMSHFTYAYFD